MFITVPGTESNCLQTVLAINLKVAPLWQVPCVVGSLGRGWGKKGKQQFDS